MCHGASRIRDRLRILLSEVRNDLGNTAESIAKGVMNALYQFVGRWKVGDITIHHPNPSLLLPSFRRSTPALSCLESVCAKRTALSVGGRIRVGRVV